jgi:Protein of unknown function (DUF2442)
MITSSVATETAAATNVRVTDRALVVELRDGRVVSVPLAWYPRLAEGSPGERRRWELLGPGIGIHWPDLHEDTSVDGLLQGVPSGESPASLKAWRATRKRPANQARDCVKTPSRIDIPRSRS